MSVIVDCILTLAVAYYIAELAVKTAFTLGFTASNSRLVPLAARYKPRQSLDIGSQALSRITSAVTNNFSALLYAKVSPQSCCPIGS